MISGEERTGRLLTGEYPMSVCVCVCVRACVCISGVCACVRVRVCVFQIVVCLCLHTYNIVYVFEFLYFPYMYPFLHDLPMFRVTSKGYETFRHRYPGLVHYYHSHKGMWNG